MPRLATEYNRRKVRTNKECGWIGVDRKGYGNIGRERGLLKENK